MKPVLDPKGLTVPLHDLGSAGERPSGRGRRRPTRRRRRPARAAGPGPGACAGLFAIEVLVCPRCVGPRRILGAVTEPHAVQRLLGALWLAAQPPPHRVPPPRDLPSIPASTPQLPPSR